MLKKGKRITTNITYINHMCSSLKGGNITQRLSSV